MKAISEEFGKTEQGELVKLFTLENDHSLTVKVSSYGATVTSIICPDRDGKLADITLGFDNLQQYISGHPYLGVTCGRFANRIAGGSFIIDGKKYNLATNNGPNTLHGGNKGFDKVVWDAECYKNSNEAGVNLSYFSKDGEENFPGNLIVKLQYAINNNNELNIRYLAETDAPTVINLTNHTYFNLNGCKNSVLDHVMTINADKYTEVDSDAIPTGKLPEVNNTAFDFRKDKRIGDHIDIAGGYDHNYVLNKSSDTELSFAGKVFDPLSGRFMETFTTEPGMQFYSANFLDGTLKGKNGTVLQKHSGFCWETQHFPDSPNHDHFPTTKLNPGDQYTQHTIYRFGIKQEY